MRHPYSFNHWLTNQRSSIRHGRHSGMCMWPREAGGGENYGARYPMTGISDSGSLLDTFGIADEECPDHLLPGFPA